LDISIITETDYKTILEIVNEILLVDNSILKEVWLDETTCKHYNPNL
jgi:hypothetical protein